MLGHWLDAGNRELWAEHGEWDRFCQLKEKSVKITLPKGTVWGFKQ